MGELGVRIDTPISALLTLNPRRVLSLFVSYSPVQSELHSLHGSLNTHTRIRTHFAAAHSLQSAPQSQ